MGASVQGYCPACGSGSLFLGTRGYVTCSVNDCPRPTAVSDLLDDRETEHVVNIGETGFTVRHPLLERLDDALLTCTVHERLSRYDGPPVEPGRYRVGEVEGRWVWSRIREAMA